MLKIEGTRSLTYLKFFFLQYLYPIFKFAFNIFVFLSTITTSFTSIILRGVPSFHVSCAHPLLAKTYQNSPVEIMNNAIAQSVKQKCKHYTVYVSSKIIFFLILNCCYCKNKYFNIKIVICSGTNPV